MSTATKAPVKTTAAADATCPHGVAWLPPEREDAITCLLCLEAKDNVPATLPTSKKRPPRVRRAATVATSSEGRTLEALSERPDREPASRSDIGMRKGKAGLPKVKSTPILPSHRQPHYQSMTNLAYGNAHPSMSGFGTQDLRRTQSLKSLLCLPAEELTKHDRRLVLAHECPRVSSRRNALNDPCKMTMPQETRERIERETHERKTSVKKRVTRYIQSLVDDEPEVDLI